MNNNQPQNRNIFCTDIGLVDYQKAWDYQEKLFQGIVDGKIKNRRENAGITTSNYFILVEHPHVYTLGKSGDLSHLLIDERQLKLKGASYYKINRGGDITYHGPGQIVGYPIFDLDHFFTDIHRFLRTLEDVIILTLADFDLIGDRSPGETGVWIDVGTPFARKICAMGVRASRWVTMHGFALNVNPDMSYFDNIVPCGILGKGVTSMQKELNKYVDIHDVKQHIKKHISTCFEAALLDVNPTDIDKK